MIAQDREAIRKAIQEIDNAMTRIDAERDFIKEAIATTSEKYQIDKKILRGMARLYHKRAVNDARAASEQLFDSYEEIFQQ